MKQLGDMVPLNIEEYVFCSTCNICNPFCLFSMVKIFMSFYTNRDGRQNLLRVEGFAAKICPKGGGVSKHIMFWGCRGNFSPELYPEGGGGREQNMS